MSKKCKEMSNEKMKKVAKSFSITNILLSYTKI